MEKQKDNWVEPTLVVYGDFTELTRASNKNFGTGDSFTFQGQPTAISG